MFKSSLRQQRVLTNTPGGELVIDLALEGEEKMWLHYNEPSKADLRKTVVISDWSLSLYHSLGVESISHQTATRVFCEALAKEKFIIYFLHGDDFLLYKPSLNLNLLFDDIAPRSEGIIKKRAFECFGLAASDLVILDYMTLRMALQFNDTQSEASPVVIKTDHIAISKYGFNEIMNSLNHNNLFLLETQIIEEKGIRQVMVIDDFEQRVQFKALKRKIPIVYQLRAKDITKFITPELSNSLKNHPLLTCVFETGQQEGAEETFELVTNLDPLLQVTQGLEYIELYYMTLRDDAPIHTNFQKVSHLILNHCVGPDGNELKDEGLANFLPHTPNVISLIILGFELSKPIPLLKHLQHLRIENGYCDSNSFFKMIEGSLHLNSLQLKNCDLEVSKDLLPEFKCPIKSLVLDRTGMGTYRNLAVFLNGADSLQSLTLDDLGSYRDESLILKAGALQKLKILKLRKLNLPDLLRVLGPIINQLPMLEELELIECIGWSRVRLSPQSRIKKLTIKIHSHDTDEPTLSWVNALANLEVLDLCGVSFNTYYQRKLPAHHLGLRTFRLQNSVPIDRENLYHFLQHALHLENLDLENLKILKGEAFPPFEPRLQALISIHLSSYTKEDVPLFQRIIDASPNLRQVKIFNCSLFPQTPLALLQELTLHEKDYAAIQPWVNYAKHLHTLQSGADPEILSKNLSNMVTFVPLEGITFKEKKKRAPLPPVFDPKNAYYPNPSHDFDPIIEPEKCMHQQYITHLLCLFLTWTTPDEDQKDLKPILSEYMKGLCTRFTALFLQGTLESPLISGGLIDYLRHLLNYEWTLDQRAKILADSTISFFFNSLLNVPLPKFSPPVYLGLFERNELNELLDVSCADFDEQYQIHLANVNHSCGLIVCGGKIYFYDPNHPDFFDSQQKSGFERSLNSDRNRLLSLIQRSLGLAISVTFTGEIPMPKPLKQRRLTPETLLLFSKNSGLSLRLVHEQLHWNALFSDIILSRDDKIQLLNHLFLRDFQDRALIIKASTKPDELTAILQTISFWLDELGCEETLMFKSRLKNNLSSLKKPYFDEWLTGLKTIHPSLTEKSHALCQLLIDLTLSIQEVICPRVSIAREISPLLLKKLETPVLSTPEALEALFRSSFGKNRLLKFQSRHHIRSALIHFQNLASTLNIPYFIIRSIDELRCTKDHFILDIDRKLSKVRGPSGLFYDFLVRHKGTRCLLFVDWSLFEHKQIIQSNTLLDEERTSDSVHLPPKMAVISCHDMGNPDVYLGGDFLDRHHHPHLNFEMPCALPNYQSSAESMVDACFGLALSINFYDSPQWKCQLLGKTILNESGLCFEPSPFLSACLDKRPFSLTIKNAPWDCPEFQSFWDDLQTEKQFTVHGRQISIPRGSNFLYDSGDSYEDEPSFVPEPMWGAEDNVFPLNPSMLSAYHSRLDIHSDGRIQEGDGWLKRTRGKTIHCLLSRSIIPSEMAMLLAKAREHEVILKMIDHREQLLVSLSESLTDSHLQQKETITVCPDELTFSDLFYSIQSYETVEKEVRFELVEKEVLKALQRGKTVLLKGELEPQLLDYIPLLQRGQVLINGVLTTFSGRLLIAHHLKPTPALNVDVPMNEDSDFELNICKALFTAFESRAVLQICGPTGGGKSTFFQHSKMLRSNASVHMGEGAMEAWISDTRQGPILLVIDEANLQNHKHSHFEDLYNPNPSIYFKGKVRPLSHWHVVALISNPDEYGGEREALPILQRHPALFVFPAFTRSYLRKNILQPLLGVDDTSMDAILAAYYHINSFKSETNPVPATPRELKMMALAYLISDRSLAAIHPILHNLLPATARRDFKIPEHPHRELLDLFVRIHRSPLSKTGALGGVVLSGEPGIGKSYFLRKILSEYGIHCEVIPAVEVSDKKSLRLLQAFHDGRGAILEEFNSDSTMESLLNSLLMGSDLQGRLSENPGFTLYITQNPPEYAGRRALTLAQQRRLLQIHFPMPSPEQIYEMLMERGKRLLTETEIRQLMGDFLWLRDEKKPITLRVILQVVDDLVYDRRLPHAAVPHSFFHKERSPERSSSKRPPAAILSESTESRDSKRLKRDGLC
ncbi:MAG: hypothetical protein NTW94_02135 [Legionellales bacterium]|nr:hypothetical protein [Legionellales bacterium]